MNRKPSISGSGIYPAWEAYADAAHDANILKRPYPDKLAEPPLGGESFIPFCHEHRAVPPCQRCIELANPADAIHFDVGLSYPAEPHECTPDCSHAVVTSVDQDRGVVTFDTQPAKYHGAVRLMGESEALYLGVAAGGVAAMSTDARYGLASNEYGNRIERQCLHPDCAWNSCDVAFRDWLDKQPNKMSGWLPTTGESMFGLQRDLPTRFFAVDADHYADMYDAGTEPDGWDANGSPVEDS